MEKLKLIQCGVGGHGRGWLDVTRQSPDFDLFAIVDLSDKELGTAGEYCNIPVERRFATLEAALATVKADAVLTVTPPPVHVKHARLVFERGLHLLTEKPMAENLENAREMVDLAKKAGRQLAVTQQYRYMGCVQKFKNLLQEEVIGKFGHGHLDFYIPADFTGTFRETMDFPLLLDMAIHHTDLIRAITGRNITKVMAKSFRPGWSWYRHDSGLKMLLELDGGLPFSYSGDWSAKGRSTSWNGTWRLQGSEGALFLEDDKIKLVRSDTWSKNEVVEEFAIPEMPRPGPGETLHRFAEAIRSGTPAETSGADNLRSLAVIMAAMKSIREDREVSLSELLPEI